MDAEEAAEAVKGEEEESEQASDGFLGEVVEAHVAEKEEDVADGFPGVFVAVEETIGFWVSLEGEIGLGKCEVGSEP